ncbi:MAG TPA: amidohydrolase family protein [Steroidobacteraceae bacterium]|nr:amidohydrolase family protein [Steroidobacteraceae bacterium]
MKSPDADAPAVLSRRTILTTAAAGLLASVPARSHPGESRAAPAAAGSAADSDLRLKDYQPRSMLHVAQTRVERARYPVIDCHTHLAWSAAQRGGVPLGTDVDFIATPQELLPVMDRKNVRIMVNLTGGVGNGLAESVRRFDDAAKGRFLTLTEPSYGRIVEAKYPRIQADAIADAKRNGAKGLKVLKTLGLVLRERIDSGALIKVDDPRFDPMWEACAGAGLPVFIHVSDPEAFFLPTDRFNERYEELNNHPDWSFHGKDFPSNQALLEARDRVLKRHPKTTFVLLHLGNNAENLAAVSECLDRYPNTLVETGARIGELGRQPRTARRFFERYQDRILFGTDAVPPPSGNETPQQVFGDALFEIYFRFLETEDEYFDYAPAATPPQGRWCIYGIGLPDSILKKVYYENAARLFGLEA